MTSPDGTPVLVGQTARRTLVDRGGNDFDFVVAPGVVIEVAKTQHGWEFWNVNIDGERFGGHSIVTPKIAEVFDAMAAASGQENEPA